MNEFEIIQYLKDNYSYDRLMGKLFFKTQVAIKIKIGDEAGYIHHRGYRLLRLKNKTYSFHRIVWLLENGSWPKYQIDHINGVRSDNRIENLRDVSNRDNCGNRLKHINGKLVGASFCKRDKRWMSRIRIKNKCKHIGAFDTELEAHMAYLKTKKEICGASPL